MTSHCRHIWSRGSSHLRAVLCMMAVRKLCGLKKPASHTDGGTCGRRAVVQCRVMLVRFYSYRLLFILLIIMLELNNLRAKGEFSIIYCCSTYSRNYIMEKSTKQIKQNNECRNMFLLMMIV